MTTQIIVGVKGGKPEAVKVAQGVSLKPEFDALVLSGGNGFEYIELIDSRSGRCKRKTFSAPAKVAKKGKKEE